MIILVLLFITIILFSIAVRMQDYHEVISFASFAFGIIISVIVGIMLCIYIYVRIPMNVKYAKTELEQRYDSLNYVINNYTSNVISLTKEISEYNSDIIKGRMYQDSFWLRDLEYSFYYDLPLIELSTEMDVLTEVGE